MDFSLAWPIDSPAFETNFFDYWRTVEDDDRRNQKSDYVVQILIRHLKSILNSAGQLGCQAESTTFQMAYQKETSLKCDWGVLEPEICWSGSCPIANYEIFNLVTLKLRSLGIYAAIARLSFDTSIRVDLSLEGGG